MRNIFHALSKYAQLNTENFLTESFVYLLSAAIAKSPAKGLLFMQSLVGLNVDEALTSPSPIEFSTQVSVEGGIPDIQILVPGEFHCFVEVKHDSHLGEGQLEYYYARLQESQEPVKALVLLTRSRASKVETRLTPDRYHHVCWYEVHKWLHNLEGNDEVLDFLIKDFTQFLEEKNMSHQRITWEYENGVKALVNFTTMLESAIGDTMAGFKIQKTGGWSWRGFYLDGEVFVGVRFDDPTRLVFEDNAGTNPTFKRALEFSDVYFFSLDSGDQYESIVQFLEASSKDYAASK